jgi:hypothetical protein
VSDCDQYICAYFWFRGSGCPNNLDDCHLLSTTASRLVSKLYQIKDFHLMARCCACLEKRLVPWASGRCLSWLELMSNTLMCMFFQPLKSMYRKRHGINVFLKTFIESPICICNRCLDLPGGTQENSIGQPSSNPQHTNKQERSTVFAQEDVHFKVEKDKRC